jgi:hypothetical protein
MITAETLVSREVHYCVSSLVSTLAGSYGNRLPGEQEEMRSLLDQAFDLARPIEDFESAAMDAGWVKAPDGWRKPTSYGHLQHPGPLETLCDVEEIEPYEREVFEHWIVSDWLADHLIKRGEKVDKDFCGLTVWARTTTGQAIASDYVIDDILRELAEA